MDRLTSFFKKVPKFLNSTKETITETYQHVQKQDGFYLDPKNHNIKRISELLNSERDPEILQGLKFILAVRSHIIYLILEKKILI